MESDIYKTPESNLVEGESTEIELASRLSRLGAAIIDSIIIMAITLPLMYFTGGFEVMQNDGEVSWQYNLMIGGVGIAAFFLINANLLMKQGQTIGKKALEIRIVDLDGNLPRVKSHLLPRYSAYFIPGYIPIIGSLLSMANVLFIFGKQRRCVHDLIGRTRVVNCSAN